MLDLGVTAGNTVSLPPLVQGRQTMNNRVNTTSGVHQACEEKPSGELEGVNTEGKDGLRCVLRPWGYPSRRPNGKHETLWGREI